MKNLSQLFPTALIASLTLGLAPFTPEPHIVEKIKWIVGGEKTLASIDWFDVLLHGTPWVLLLVSGIAKLMMLKHSK